ncbi:MAG: hypothetical protein ACE5GE_13100 [Phycisphaerae bacterium]
MELRFPTRLWTALSVASLAISAAVRAQPAPPNSADPVLTNPVTLEQLSGALNRTRSELRRLIGGADLMDGLYFGWMEQPHARADIACAVKTFTALEYEERLRRLGNGALSDAQVGAMLDWLGGLAARAAENPDRQGFYPHRVRPNLKTLLARLGPSGPGLRLFGFVDRATATRYGDVTGDFDLLACLGFRVVAEPPAPTHPGGDEFSILSDRSGALSIGLVRLDPKPSASTHSPQAPDAAGIALLGGTLADFIDPAFWAGDPRHPDDLPAIQDRVFGESWAESLARRGLYRGCTGRPGAAVVGWRPPRVRAEYDKSAQIRLAMWVHAVWGQRLALIEGWRDRRDGSASAYPSVFADPATVATIAHTALDILDAAQDLAAFDRPARFAVLVTASAIHPADDNRWAQPYADIFEALVQKQKRFDVVPAWGLQGLDNRDAKNAHLLAPPDDALTPAVRTALADLTGWQVHRLNDMRIPAGAFADQSPTPAIRVSGPDLLVLHGNGRSVALANTGPGAQSAWITSTSPLYDVLSKRRFDHPDRGVVCDPWQVRVLRPADR